MNQQQTQPEAAAGFQYHYGDRPLEGYTIERAAGRGGFGEVYYAVSDSGRQVALKAIQSHENIELRGISQCMNLKSPHLVTIFDIRHNPQGKPFVIMEYVAGPSLRELLDEMPAGLGTQKAAFFLREIAKGLTFLHDCGIVHRDLKPSNIFYENGYVKIVDYGLSKAIAVTPNQSQTITVGTVHYMAPEIGHGKYDRSIDIYALGVILYEMLTGQVPFFGASPGEILMKHVAENVDLSNIEQPFARVISKALAKDPALRYQTVQEMVEDLFGTETIRNSVSQFSPNDLSLIAGKVGRQFSANKAPEQNRPANDSSGSFEDIGRQLGKFGDEVSRQVSGAVRQALGKQGRKVTSSEVNAANAADPMTRRQRRTLSFIALGAFGIGISIISGFSGDDAFAFGLWSFFMIFGTTYAITIARWRLLINMEPSPARNWATAIFGLLGALIVSLFMLTDAPDIWHSQLKGTLISLLALGLVDWWKLTNPLRVARVKIGPALGPALLGGIAAAAIFNGVPVLTVGVIGGAVLAVQILSPFVPGGWSRGYPQSFAQAPVAGGPQTTDNKKYNDSPKPPTPKRCGQLGVATADLPHLSPYKRLWALLLSFGMFLGFFGLQRFYVGKIGTGLLYLCTGGLLGVGQIIDIIMITTGGFADKHGRHLLIWEDDSFLELKSEKVVRAQSPEQPSSWQPPEPWDFIGGFFAFLGYLIFLPGLLVGLAMALDLPGFICIADADFNAEMAGKLDDANWPEFILRIGFIISILLTIIATALIITARRKNGPWHIIRAALGMFTIQLTISMLAGSLSRFGNNSDLVEMFQKEQFSSAINLWLNRSDSETAIFAAIMFVAALVILAWPGRARQAVQPSFQPQGEELL